MAVITKIEIQKNNENRCNIYLDDNFYSGVESIIVFKYRLKVGMEIDKKQLDEIIFDSEKEKAFTYAVEYVCKYVATEKQLINKLYDKGYHKNIVEYVINKCKEYSYIDDLKYAKAYIFQNRAVKGKLRLEQELIKKGIKKEIVLEALEEYKEEDGCLNIAKKKAKNKDLDDPKQYASLIRYLQYRGYEFDDIKEALEIIKKEKYND